MLDNLDRMHREGEIKINSVKTLKQMREIQNEDGKVNTNGKDRVVATAISLAKQVREQAIRLTPYNINFEGGRGNW